MENMNSEQSNPTKKSTKNLFIALGIIAAVCLIITIIITIVNIYNRPNEEKVNNIIQQYISAVSEGNAEKMLQVVDIEGYIIFQEVGKKKFDTTYENKSDFINSYLSNNNYTDLNGAIEKLSEEFENSYGYFTYTIQEISTIENLSESNQLIIAKGKVQLQSNRYSSVNSIKFYILKNDGDYKLVGVDM